MREIKFRAWDKPGQLMVYMGQKDTHDLDGNDRSYWTYLVPGARNGTWFELSVKDNGEVDREIYHGELMQFTGLKDKNGKEIYEGDILGIDHVGGELEPVGEVIFDADYAQYAIKYINGGWAELWQHLLEKKNEGKEVIGNIHSNPELLTKGTI